MHFCDKCVANLATFKMLGYPAEFYCCYNNYGLTISLVLNHITGRRMWAGHESVCEVTRLVKNNKDACVCSTILCIAYTALAQLRSSGCSRPLSCLHLLFLRVQPTSGKVFSVTQLQPEELSPSSMSSKKRDQHLYFSR